jgi:hypothetical protein
MSSAVLALAMARRFDTRATSLMICKTDAQCSYNGRCTSGVCECDPAWHGEQCATLNLMPAHHGAGLNVSDADGPLSSWGATVTRGDDGVYHMYAAQFVQHCGFNQWDYNSRIVHAVASQADGVFEVKDVVWPVWAHNPAVVRGPRGEWVMTFVAARTVGSEPTPQFRMPQPPERFPIPLVTERERRGLHCHLLEWLCDSQLEHCVEASRAQLHVDRYEPIWAVE